MSEGPSISLRVQVAQRAGYRCEYCLMRENDSFLSFHVDHIIARKHGGGDEFENLAYACPHCNQCKGSDLSTYLKRTQEIIPLFHPRKHNWEVHFEVDAGLIAGKTLIGEATVQLLQFNQPERLLIRKLLAETGRYP